MANPRGPGTTSTTGALPTPPMDPEKVREIQMLEEAVLVESKAENEAEFSAQDAEQNHAALDELPAEQRELLVLRFL